MTREWKPGDVAIASYSHDDEPVRYMFTEHRYGDARGRSRWESEEGSHSYDFRSADWWRPLVTIDPENREDVERLASAWMDAQSANLTSEPMSIHGLRMQAALREFANPPDPKPEEPLGLGAVVEDAEGVTWVRAGDSHDGRLHDNWRGANGDQVGWWSKYDDLDVVRVLSEGVQP